MRNKEIGVGDMVQVVKEYPCGCTNELRRTFILDKLITMSDPICNNCFKTIMGNFLVAVPTKEYKSAGSPISCLIKISPPPEALKETTDTELEVPA